MTVETCSHQDAWLLLPWLANGRLAAAERLRVEEHVRGCTLCAREVAAQRRLCDVLTEPERVTYAPGPSFRKLMDRIDGRAAATSEEPRVARQRRFGVRASTWRPPGLAWAASFLLLTGFLGVAVTTTYRWSQPRYITHTSAAPAAASAAVLHVAFLPSLSIGEAGETLRRAGARVVEGPDSSGIVGVAPVAASGNAADANRQLQALAARLRLDPRVRWIQPLPAAPPADAPQRGPPQP